MTLKIKRTPDSVTLTDSDLRDAITDYIEQKANRLVLNSHAEGIRYHATNKGEARSGKDCDTVFVTVQLQDQSPRELHTDAKQDDGLDDIVNALRDGRVYGVTDDIISFTRKLANMNSTLAGGSKLHQDFELIMRTEFRALMRSFRTANQASKAKTGISADDEDDFA